MFKYSSITFWLISILVILVPQNSIASTRYQLLFGGGYTANSCEFNQSDEKIGCYSSPRLSLGINWGSDEDAPSASEVQHRESGNTVYYGNNFQCFICNIGGNSSNDSAAYYIILVGLIVFVLVFYGIVAAIGGALSSKLSFGFFYSGDYLNSNALFSQQYLLQNIHRFGAQVSFYFGSSQFAMRLSTAYTKANFKSSNLVDTESLSTDGVSSSIGFGYIPRPGNKGFFLYYELEGSYFTGGNVLNYVKEKRKEATNLTNITHALVTGWAF